MVEKVPLVISHPGKKSSLDVLKELKTNAHEGLSSHDVKQRQLAGGKNWLPQAKKHGWFVILLERFKESLVIILLLAALASLLLREYTDAIIILAAIGIDVLLSFIQVWRTEKTLENMRNQVKDTVSVIRNGKTQTINAENLVVGDVFHIRAGKHVPADARLLKAVNLRTNESALTGESTDISKTTTSLTNTKSIASRTNMIFAGTDITNGSGLAVVTSIGIQTEFGKIAALIREQKNPDSPLRKTLQKTGSIIGTGVIAIVILLALLGILMGEGLYETLRTAITLIVSAIPEDLTMILTIAMTIGVVRILKKGGVIRKLSSGETLGSATVICTDKTGTLTEGKMNVLHLDFLQGSILSPQTVPTDPIQQLSLVGLVLANDAIPLKNSGHKTITTIEDYYGSTTERVALSFAENTRTVLKEKLLKQWKQRDGIPFNPQWKYRAGLFDHPTQNSRFLFVTGAPDTLLERSSHALDSHCSPVKITSKRKRELSSAITQLGGEGNRLLAVAVRKHVKKTTLKKADVHDLTFLGVLVIKDPVRKEVVQSIRETITAGIPVKIITGDHAATATAIAREIGLTVPQDSVLTGEEFQAMSDSELKKILPRTIIFARVEPLDKQRIIRLLQEQGHVVAMTGDGINDAVALKSADIGVAMASGSDIAKDAADLVLLNNSFATIISAVKEGRVIRDNIRKVIIFLLSTNMAEVMIFFASLLLKLPLPLIPAQILWINLVTDGTSDIALSLEPAEKGVMQRLPERQSSFLPKELIIQIIFSGIIMTIGTILIFWLSLKQTNFDIPYARTMAFSFLAVASLLSTWSYRSLKRPLWDGSADKNNWLYGSALFSFVLQLVAIYTPWANTFFGTIPINISDWLIIGLAGVATILLIDSRKILFHHQTR